MDASAIYRVPLHSSCNPPLRPTLEFGPLLAALSYLVKIPTANADAIMQSSFHGQDSTVVAGLQFWRANSFSLGT